MKIEEAANYLKEELARWERDCKSNHPMKDALALAIQMLETGEVYMTGDDYNLFIKGYKDGMKDYKSLVEESDPADSENKVRLIDADELKKNKPEEYIDGTRVYFQYEIDNAPTVEVTDYDTGYQDGLEDGLNDIRPQGEWIRYRDNPHQPEHIKCSNCGQYWSISEQDKIFDFCFKCGAYMRKGGKE